MGSRRVLAGVAPRGCALLAAVFGLLVLIGLLASGPAAAAGRRTPTLAPANTVIDGPSSAIVGLSGLAVARDGTGALVYLRNDAGAPHVFVSLLRNGAFQAPLRIDGGLATPSSQPVVAVTNNGMSQIAFINAGTLYTVGTPNLLTPPSAPVAIGSGASNPSLSLSTFGKGYLVFTGTGGGGHDVRVAALIGGQWNLAGAPLDFNPAADAGAGAARPQAVTAGDGTAIVVWGESGHVYARRVLGTNPSPTVLQADSPSVAGWNEVSADLPVVGAGGDSSYAAVAFHEVLTSGGVLQSRVLVNRLHASRFDGIKPADPLTTPGPEGASRPALAVTEYGYGLITAAGDISSNLFATALAGPDQPGGTTQVNTLGQASTPDAVPAVAGTVSTLIAWQQDPGGGAAPEIRVRYAPDGVDLDTELVVSTPTLGPTAADQGLAAGGDASGDAAIAWVQGSGEQTRIVTAQLFQAPHGFAPSTAFAYATTAQPQFTWSAAGEQWGALNYLVNVDGKLVGGTQGTSLVPSAPLIQGRHLWQASATNLAGLTVLARPSTVFVDSVPPRITKRLAGSRKPGAPLTLTVSVSDRPPLLPAADGSGVASLTLKWGDRTRPLAITPIPVTSRRRLAHSYRRRGRYTLTLTAVDRAGNRSVVTRTVTIRGSGRNHRHPPRRTTRRR